MHKIILYVLLSFIIPTQMCFGSDTIQTDSKDTVGTTQPIDYRKSFRRNFLIGGLYSIVVNRLVAADMEVDDGINDFSNFLEGGISGYVLTNEFYNIKPSHGGILEVLIGADSSQHAPNFLLSGARGLAGLLEGMWMVYPLWTLGTLNTLDSSNIMLFHIMDPILIASQYGMMRQFEKANYLTKAPKGDPFAAAATGFFFFHFLNETTYIQNENASLLMAYTAIFLSYNWRYYFNKFFHKKPKPKS